MSFFFASGCRQIGTPRLQGPDLYTCISLPGGIDGGNPAGPSVQGVAAIPASSFVPLGQNPAPAAVDGIGGLWGISNGILTT